MIWVPAQSDLALIWGVTGLGVAVFVVIVFGLRYFVASKFRQIRRQCFPPTDYLRALVTVISTWENRWATQALSRRDKGHLPTILVTPLKQGIQ